MAAARWVCTACGSPWAPGAPCCPRCRSLGHVDDTEEDGMLKISRDGIVSDSADVRAAEVAESAEVADVESVLEGEHGVTETPEAATEASADDAQAPDAAPGPAPDVPRPPRVPPRRTPPPGAAGD